MICYLQTFGEGKCIQSLYTGLKQQGQIVVTYYDSNTAILAYTRLNGRKLNDRQLYVELQKSAKDAHACKGFSLVTPIPGHSLHSSLEPRILLLEYFSVSYVRTYFAQS